MKSAIYAPLLLLVMLGGVGTAAHAQQYGASQSTTPPDDARFEVVSSPLAVRWTFRLDRVTGHVAVLAHTSPGDANWEDMTVVGLPAVAANGHARFQIFTSGLGALWTFLIDTATGKTWQLQRGKTAANWAWIPLPE